MFPSHRRYHDALEMQHSPLKSLHVDQVTHLSSLILSIYLLYRYSLFAMNFASLAIPYAFCIGW